VRAPRNSYDEVPYGVRVFPQTHPDRLAVVARLFGLEPAPVPACRVLELGCGSGANLVPMAFHLRGSEFVGVDLSERQVATARAAIQGLELANIQVRHADLHDIDDDWGRFDYIICHGVYSWVPPETRERILDVLARHLSDAGIGYVSYNTYPGWHDNEKMRVMMLFHAGTTGAAEGRIEGARAMLNFLAEAAPGGDTPYTRWLRELRESLGDRDDPYLFHEYLEAVNEPVYFSQFVERAGRHGLQYLGEANVAQMFPHDLAPPAAKRLRELGPDILRFEQYLDFLRNRRFRQTLLCREGLPIDREVAAGRVQGLLAAADVAPVETLVNLQAGHRVTFRRTDGARVHTDIPLLKAALLTLQASFPLALDLDTLVERSVRRLSGVFEPQGIDAASSREALASHLLTFYVRGMVELHAWQAPCVSAVTERPAVSRMTAYQAAHGDWVVSQRHLLVDGLGPGRRQLLGLLDGTRDRGAILQALTERVRAGTLTTWDDESATVDAPTLIAFIERHLDAMLAETARAGLLVE
jgi:methyltransferase-like protein